MNSLHWFEGAANHLSDKARLHGLIGDVVVGGDLDEAPTSPSKANYEELCMNFVGNGTYWPRDTLRNVCKIDGFYHEVSSVRERVFREILDYVGGVSTYSNYIWFKYAFRMFGYIIPCLMSQIIPFGEPILPYLDPKFFDICALVKVEEIRDRKLQFLWAKRYFPETCSLERIKDGVRLPVEGKNLYSTKIKILNLKNKLKYYICRMSLGRVNFSKRESYPYYGEWYRKHKSIRDYFATVLLDKERGLWNKSIVQEIMRDLRIGRNAWLPLSTLLCINIMLESVGLVRGNKMEWPTSKINFSDNP